MMAAIQTRTFDLLADQASYIDSLVGQGLYASPNDVIQAGLLALRDQSATEAWLRNEVVAAYDKVEAEPTRAIPAETVFAELRRRHGLARAQTDRDI